MSAALRVQGSTKYDHRVVNSLRKGSYDDLIAQGLELDDLARMLVKMNHRATVAGVTACLQEMIANGLLVVDSEGRLDRVTKRGTKPQAAFVAVTA